MTKISGGPPIFFFGSINIPPKNIPTPDFWGYVPIFVGLPSIFGGPFLLVDRSDGFDVWGCE